MGIGLGKNSPIVLTLTRENYEALIARHGQHVRVVNSCKCNCILGSGYPDPNCKVCNGDGIYYRFQKQKNLYSQICRVESIDGDTAVAIIPEWFLSDYTIESVILNNKRLSDLEYAVEEKFIVSSLFRKWDNIVISGSVQRDLEFVGSIRYVGNGSFILDLGIQSEIGLISFDIISVSSLRNETKGIDYTVKSFERNSITVTDLIDNIENDEIIAKLSYMPFERFLIHNQSKNKIVNNFLKANGGDSTMTFPFEFDVMENDVVTLMFATKLAQSIIPMGRAIPEWFVSEIISICDNQNEYVNNLDYELKGRNQIRWISDNKPEIGKNISIKYRFNPSYKVLTNFPHEIRSSENQLLPRMAALKLIVAGGNLLEGIHNPTEIIQIPNNSIDDVARDFFNNTNNNSDGGENENVEGTV